MKLYEINFKSNIVVEFSNEKSFNANVIKRDASRKYLIVSIDNLSIKEDIISIYISGKNKLYIWQNIKIKHLKDNLFIIPTDEDGRAVNRRNSYRIDIFKPCKVYLKESLQNEDTLIETTLKDLSSTGFCFFVKEKLSDSLKKAELKKLCFSDGEFIFNCQFNIKRELEVQNIYFYGCEFINLNNSSKLDKYLFQEQRKIIQENKKN